MKKIGIVSVICYNYGSMLQAFALQQKVRDLGAETDVLNYAESKIKKINRCRDYEYLYSRIKMVLKNLRLRDKQTDNGSIALRNKMFQNFVQDNINLTQQYSSLKELSKMCYGYDLILLGSDQVWHPMNIYMDYFTMNFVPDSVIKATYAPSFGVKTIPNRYRNKYRSFLSRIQYLSCREKDGIDIIKNIIGKDAINVCDPTLLLTREDWNEQINGTGIYEYPYIFCYMIGNNPKQRDFVKQLKKETGIKNVALIHIDEYVESDTCYADETPFDVGPFDFIRLIRDAKYVVTDSFHASVFSILFHKEFIVFDRFEETKGKVTTSRITSLLDVTGLSDNLISSDNKPHVLTKRKETDWNSVDLKLAEFKSKSLEYLIHIVNSKDEK